ncbi:MAG: FlgD immunoglobulin-like domain containing protein [Armatimonadota bacterium]|nr:FlgD immunoglobulin-like domain containing protein [Armatimonadota bacterium]
MKRSYLLCLLAGVMMVALALPGFAAVEIYQLKVPAAPSCPAFIFYTLNCPADVTIEILAYDTSAGTLGSVVRTANLGTQTRGKHMWIWPCTNDSGTKVPLGAYKARITATANQASWGPIIGIYKNDDWDTEYPPNPSVPDAEGYYGIAINKNPNSPYYGRIYVCHKVQKEVFMYDPDGAFLGAMNDAGIAWGTSAPWDISIGDDDYVYVGDRSTPTIYCFKPDGSDWIRPANGQLPVTTYYRAQFTRSSGGTAYQYGSGSQYVRDNRVDEATHSNWTSYRNLYQVGVNAYTTTTNAFGMWVSPDRSYLFQCYMPEGGCTNNFVTKWKLNADGYTYSRLPWQSPDLGNVIDVDMGHDGTYLWVTRQAATGTAARGIYKLSTADGSVLDSSLGIISWGLMCATDPVGNVAVTYGKGTPTWASYYWGLFAAPGTNSRTKVTSEWFEVKTNNPPVVIPYSDSWTFSNPSYPGKLPPDDSSTASVTFKVIDAEGWTQLQPVNGGGCTLNLSSLGYGSATLVDSVAQDTSDPAGLTAICTKANIKAKRGAECKTHKITATPYDQVGSTSWDFDLPVAGCKLTGIVHHTRWLSDDKVAGATIVARGGTPGFPGYPFTYRSPLTGDGQAIPKGQAILDISEGTYQVWAEKPGFASTDPITVVIPAFYSETLNDNIYLRPLTMAEARATSNGSTVNIEGLCFAQPWGTAVPSSGIPEQKGYDERRDLMQNCWQWYMCDPADPSNGLLCLMYKPDANYPLQWDDPNGTDPDGNPVYFGKRPSNGETIMITGTLDIPGGGERRVKLLHNEMLTAFELGTHDQYYMNLTDLGVVPSKPLPNPVYMSISEIYHSDTTGFSPTWGQFIRTSDAWVVKNVADGLPADTVYTNAVPYSYIADASGNWALCAVDTPTKLGFNLPTVGAKYDFKGAGGRRNRYGFGCIRPRNTGDVVLKASPTTPADLSTIRSLPSGSAVNVQGRVTALWSSSFYIQAEDRSVGIRVQASAGPWVNVGDKVQVQGTLGMLDGERVINVTAPVIELSNGSETNVPAALGLRTREVGGADYDANNPGVTDGRGALNVGLRVKVCGKVTARDTNGQWFYVWDGANRANDVLDDGSGNPGVRVESTQAVAVDDWVDIDGIVSTNATAVPGRTIPVIIPRATVTKVTAFNTITDAVPWDPNQSGVMAPYWNIIGLPACPKEWDPMVVFNGYDPAAGNLWRWEAMASSFFVYDQWDPVPFGGMLLGDGYYLLPDSDWALSFEGLYRTDDQWISLPIGNNSWTLIGHPFNHNTWLSDVKVHTGGAVMTIADAANAGLLATEGWWLDNTTGSLMTVDLPENWPPSCKLLVWHGYFIRSMAPQISLIIPNAPDAGPDPFEIPF